MVTPGGQLQVAGPLTGCASAGAQVGEGVPVNLGIGGGRPAGTLQRGEQPGGVGGSEEPRVLQEAGELISIGGVPG